MCWEPRPLTAASGLGPPVPGAGAGADFWEPSLLRGGSLNVDPPASWLPVTNSPQYVASQGKHTNVFFLFLSLHPSMENQNFMLL